MWSPQQAGSSPSKPHSPAFAATCSNGRSAHWPVNSVTGRGMGLLSDGDWVANRAIDRVGIEDVLDHHDRGSDHTGAVAQLARHDPQVARGHRQRPADRHLAHAREQLLMRVGDVAADHDRARVEEVDRAREHLAEIAAGVADQLDGERLAGAHERDDVAAGPGLEPGPGETFGERAAAGDGFQAARVAAAADDVVVPGDPDVADVAGGALGAAVDVAVGDDAAADAGADLDEEQVLDVAPVRPVLAEGHDIDVVVDEYGRVVVGGEPAWDRVAVPAGHDRRRHRLPARERDRPRNADADAAHVARAAADVLEKIQEALMDPREHRLGPLCDVHV